MTHVYRILRKRYAKRPFDGEGAYRFGGRWSSPGTRVVYAAEHLSLAMIEYFVHIDPEDPPRDLVMVSADVPEKISRAAISTRSLPTNWRHSPAPSGLRAIGDRFIREGQTAILIVPSALAPAESNWLINPTHPDARRLRVRPPQPFEYDRRFFA